MMNDGNMRNKSQQQPKSSMSNHDEFLDDEMELLWLQEQKRNLKKKQQKGTADVDLASLYHPQKSVHDIVDDLREIVSKNYNDNDDDADLMNENADIFNNNNTLDDAVSSIYNDNDYSTTRLTTKTNIVNPPSTLDEWFDDTHPSYEIVIPESNSNINNNNNNVKKKSKKNKKNAEPVVDKKKVYEKPQIHPSDIPRPPRIIWDDEGETPASTSVLVDRERKEFIQEKRRIMMEQKRREEDEQEEERQRQRRRRFDDDYYSDDGSYYTGSDQSYYSDDDDGSYYSDYSSDEDDVENFFNNNNTSNNQRRNPSSPPTMSPTSSRRQYTNDNSRYHHRQEHEQQQHRDFRLPNALREAPSSASPTLSSPKSQRRVSFDMQSIGKKDERRNDTTSRVRSNINNTNFARGNNNMPTDRRRGRHHSSSNAEYYDL